MTSTSISKRLAILKGHLSPNVSTDGTLEKHYDLLVIGGGSGGVACAKEGGAHVMYLHPYIVTTGVYHMVNPPST